MTGTVPKSKEVFEQEYARRSGVTVDWLHEHGRGAIPCDCDEEICEGWQMVNLTEHAEFERLFGRA